MSLATVLSRAHIGMHAPMVQVEVHLANGLPGFTMVGMAETAVKEARDRVRSAIATSRFQFPVRRITVNLAPADLPKSGTHFDLPIALGILAASGQIPIESTANYEFLGELALNGALRSVRGVLPAALACVQQQHQLICPLDNGPEAALGEASQVFPAASLLQVCTHLTGDQQLQSAIAIPYSKQSKTNYGDFSEVVGQSQAKRALEIAAAGNHHALLYGPPGTGKSMLAARLPGILPPLSKDAALEVASVSSLTQPATLLGYPQRPFIAPHHTASAVAMVGGGSIPKPGDISKAHNGVLFLDELPEFPRQTLEVLRQPLESGRIQITRSQAQVEFPAQFQLIAAMNPCPCGYYGSNSTLESRTCCCSISQIQRYRARLSGPLLNRIDLHVPVNPLAEGELWSTKSGESSRDISARVNATRNRQEQRQAGFNAQLSEQALKEIAPLTRRQQQLLENAMLKFGFSTRVIRKVQKIALTIADLAHCDRIEDAHLMEALGYRNLDRPVD